MKKMKLLNQYLASAVCLSLLLGSGVSKAVDLEKPELLKPGKSDRIDFATYDKNGAIIGDTFRIFTEGDREAGAKLFEGNVDSNYFPAAVPGRSLVEVLRLSENEDQTSDELRVTITRPEGQPPDTVHVLFDFASDEFGFSSFPKGDIEARAAEKPGPQDYTDLLFDSLAAGTAPVPFRVWIQSDSNIPPIPEPATWLLFASGLVMLVAFGRKINGINSGHAMVSLT